MLVKMWVRRYNFKLRVVIILFYMELLCGVST